MTAEKKQQARRVLSPAEDSLAKTIGRIAAEVARAEHERREAA